MTDSELAELERLAGDAPDCIETENVGSPWMPEDAPIRECKEFYTAARTTVPALIRELREARAALSNLETQRQGRERVVALAMADAARLYRECTRLYADRDELRAQLASQAPVIEAAREWRRVRCLPGAEGYQRRADKPEAALRDAVDALDRDADKGGS